MELVIFVHNEWSFSRAVGVTLTYFSGDAAAASFVWMSGGLEKPFQISIRAWTIGCTAVGIFFYGSWFLVLSLVIPINFLECLLFGG